MNMTTTLASETGSVLEMLAMGNIMALIITMVIVFIPGIIAGSLALYCIIPDLKKRKTLMKQLLLFLCVTDVFGCVGTIVLQAVNIVHDVSNFMCSVANFLTVFFPMLSGATATFMAIERCMALRAPYWYQQYMFTWNIWAPFVSVVLVITVVSLFPEMGLGEIFITRIYGDVSIDMCGSFPDGMASSAQLSVFPASYGVMGLILVLINLCCNIAVLITLQAMNKRVLPSTRASGSPSQEFEMTKLVLVLCATYLICWVPVNVELVILQLGGEKNVTVSMITHTLMGLNFAVDPLIYLTMKRNYREKVKRLCCCKRTSVDVSTDSSQNVPATNTNM